MTKAQARDIENTQKVALKIILDENYTSYEVAYTLLNISPLEYRRTEFSTNYAIKLFKSPKSSDYFEPAKKGIDTRSDQLLVKENLTNTRRCQNAPHNYLARLINQNKTRILKYKL